MTVCSSTGGSEADLSWSRGLPRRVWKVAIWGLQFSVYKRSTNAGTSVVFSPVRRREKEGRRRGRPYQIVQIQHPANEAGRLVSVERGVRRQEDDLQPRLLREPDRLAVEASRALSRHFLDFLLALKNSIWCCCCCCCCRGPGCRFLLGVMVGRCPGGRVRRS